jgi:hypothetical protein
MSHTPRTRTHTRALVALGLALVLTACSLIVNKDKDQCSTDGDCAATQGAVCLQGVCVLSPANAEAGADGSADGPLPTADAGCTPKVPAVDTDFLNEKCTTSECIDFDNCARLGACPAFDGGEGGALPALITPPVGGI